MSIERTLGRAGGVIESLLIGLAGGLAPWMMDAPVAYLAGRNIVEVLGWPVWLGLVAGIGTELLGLSCTGEALKFRDYNAIRPKTAPAAPEGLAWLMTGIYFAGGLVLALLATVEGLESFALIVFPVLGAVGTFVHAMRQDHRRRLAELEKARAERRAEAQKRKAERAEERKQAEVVLGTLANSAQNAQGLAPRIDTGQAVAAFFAANPQATQEQAAQAIGVRRQTISYWRAKLDLEAKLNEEPGRGNGNGHKLEAAV